MTVSFPSTLHLHPILDVLLSRIPENCHPEVRLGLQEALVNAAKHGNKLDPGKSISIRFRSTSGGYWWVISDQGQGFRPEAETAQRNHPCALGALEVNPSEENDQHQKQDHKSYQDHEQDHERDCGRGLYILHHIFDQVEWSSDGKELMLYKRINRWIFPSLFWNS